MDDRQRAQVELLVSLETRIARRDIARRTDSVIAHSAMHGRLQSGATIKLFIVGMSEIADAFVDELSAKIRKVAADQESFERLSLAVKDCTDECKMALSALLQLLNGPRLQGVEHSVARAASGLLDQARQDTEAKLALIAFEFAGEPEHRVSPAIDNKTLKVGGSPGLAFWDDMWAAMAFALYDGALVPQSQADVERAMTQWAEDHGHTPAESTIRKRARLIWDRIAHAKP